MNVRINFATMIAFYALVRVTSSLSTLQTLEQQILKQKNTVRTTLNDLRQTKRDLSFDLNKKLANSKLSSMQSINDIVNPTLIHIQTEISESTSQGKDPSSCYDNAKSKLRELSLAGFANLESCRNAAFLLAKPSLDDVDKTIQNAVNVMTSLNAIYPNCFGGSSVLLESCIVSNLSSLNPSVQQLRIAANDVRTYGTRAIGNAQTSALSCNQETVDNVRRASTEAKTEATRCIDAAK